MSQRQAYYFNPTCEMEVANGLANYMPPAQMLRFVEDLETLPLVYATPDDCILVTKLPSVDFINRLESAGFALPSFRLVHKLDNLAGQFVPSPWGWSPAAAKKLGLLGAEWKDELRPFFSRQFAKELSLLLAEKNIPRTINSDYIARYVDSLSDVENLLMDWGKVVIKAPYSSSGRGLQMLRRNHLNVNIINKTRSLIAQQGGVMLEPLMDVLCDFAFEFKLEKGMVNFVGYSHFVTTENGQYQGHQIPFSPDKLPAEAKHLWDIGVINAALDELQAILQKSDLAHLYEGYFGVDAFVYKDEDGNVLLQPCLELNLRNNMGIVALHLEKHIAAGSSCNFQIVSPAHVSVSLFDKDMSTRYPLLMADNKIVSGYLPLTSPSQEAINLAYILVEKL